MRNQLRKRNLLRKMRSVAAFQALVDARVWGRTSRNILG